MIRLVTQFDNASIRPTVGTAGSCGCCCCCCCVVTAGTTLVLTCRHLAGIVDAYSSVSEQEGHEHDNRRAIVRWLTWVALPSSAALWLTIFLLGGLASGAFVTALAALIGLTALFAYGRGLVLSSRRDGTPLGVVVAVPVLSLVGFGALFYVEVIVGFFIYPLLILYPVLILAAILWGIVKLIKAYRGDPPPDRLGPPPTSWTDYQGPWPDR